MRKSIFTLLLLLVGAMNVAADNPPETLRSKAPLSAAGHDAVQRPGMSEASVRKERVDYTESRSDDAVAHYIAAPTISVVVPPALRWVDGVTFRALTPASQSFMLG